MAELPDDRRYTKEHEWAKEDGGRILVGITDYAQDQLGDVVYVSLPEPGTEVKAGEPMGEVESTKSVSDLFSPVTGKIVEKNAEVEGKPEMINSDPYGSGWLVAIQPADPDLGALLSADEYGKLTGG